MNPIRSTILVYFIKQLGIRFKALSTINLIETSDHMGILLLLEDANFCGEPDLVERYSFTRKCESTKVILGYVALNINRID